MQNILLKGHVQADGTLELHVPKDLAESDVEVNGVVQLMHSEAEKMLPEERSGHKPFLSLPFDDHAAQCYASIRADMEARG